MGRLLASVRLCRFFSFFNLAIRYFRVIPRLVYVIPLFSSLENSTIPVAAIAVPKFSRKFHIVYPLQKVDFRLNYHNLSTIQKVTVMLSSGYPSFSATLL